MCGLCNGANKKISFFVEKWSVFVNWVVPDNYSQYCN